MDMKQQPKAVLGVAVCVVVLVTAGIYIFFNQEEPQPEQTVSAPPAPPARVPPPPPPPPPEPTSVELPPLGGSDPFVRELVAMLSAHPDFLAWLATDELIRTFVVSVENVANGNNPSRHVAFMKPDAGFQTEGSDSDLMLASASYERYDGLTRIISSLDIAGTASLYQQLLPLLDDAYAELGVPDATFSDTFARAVVHVLSTPIVNNRSALVTRTPFYEYRDPELESLTAAQKQLLGVGPDNLRIIRRTIRDIATEIGFANLPE